jgi:hypothetical protein
MNQDIWFLPASGSHRPDEGRKSLTDRPTIPRGGIQKTALTLVLPLVIASMLSIGLINDHRASRVSGFDGPSGIGA